MTSESSGSVRFSLWGFWGLVSPDLARPLVKLKSFPEVIDQDMKPRGGDVDWKCWAGLKSFNGWYLA